MIEKGEITIYEAMDKIKAAKYAIPPFQREYQWPKEKIVKLWDSILMGYPISTFLFWKYDRRVADASPFLRFTQSAKFRSAANAKTEAEARGFALPANIEEGILDGQQRLTSLYLSLYGYCSILQKNQHAATNDGEHIELYIDLANNTNQEVDEDGFENVKTYEMKFSSKALRLPFFKLREIISDSFKNRDTRQDAINSIVINLAEDRREKAKEILNKLCAKIYDEPIIQYQNVEGEESEALEMFIRFNNGGKPLSKADISDATITYYWPEAPSKFKTVVKYKGNTDLVEERLNAYRDFGLNFIIRLGTMLFEDNVAAPLGGRTIRGLKENWSKIKNSLADTASFLNELGLKTESYQSRWNVLLPIIYFVYNNPNYAYYRDAILAYLSRSTLFKYFQNGTTAKLTRLKKAMNEHQLQGKPIMEISLLDEISELKVTEAKIDEVLECKKGSPIAKIALEWLNYTISSHVVPGSHEDHLQPRSLFTIPVPPAGVTNDQWSNWRNICDMLPNLQFFEGELNIFKSNRELFSFYENLADGENGKIAYQKRYLLFPIANETDQQILSLQKFGDFFEKRKKVIKQKLGELLGLYHDDDPELEAD